MTMKKIDVFVFLFLLIVSSISCQKDSSLEENVLESKLIDLQEKYNINFEKIEEIPHDVKAISIEELKGKLDEWKDFKSETYFGTVESSSSRATNSELRISWDRYGREVTLEIHKCYAPGREPVAIGIHSIINLDALSMQTDVWPNTMDFPVVPGYENEFGCQVWTPGTVYNLSLNYNYLYEFYQGVVIIYYVRENAMLYRVHNVVGICGRLIAGENVWLRLEANEYYRTEI